MYCIPKEIRNLKKVDLDEFKEKLDSFLTKIPDQPKIDGLIPVSLDPTTVKHSNSLPHQVQHQARWGTNTRILYGSTSAYMDYYFTVLTKSRLLQCCKNYLVNK